MNRQLNVQDLGLKDYKQAWDYQETLFKDTIDIKIKNPKFFEAETIHHVMKFLKS